MNNILIVYDNTAQYLQFYVFRAGEFSESQLEDLKKNNGKYINTPQTSPEEEKLIRSFINNFPEASRRYDSRLPIEFAEPVTMFHLGYYV